MQMYVYYNTEFYALNLQCTKQMYSLLLSLLDNN